VNVYWCDAGEHSVVVEHVADRARHEIEMVCDLVVAPSRGVARAVFVAANQDAWLEFMDKISIHKKGVVGFEGRPQVVRGMSTDFEKACWGLMKEWADYQEADGQEAQ